VVEFASLRSKTRFDVSETFPVGKLRKSHAEILIQTREPLDFVIAFVTGDTAVKSLKWQMFYDLRENQLACIHGHAPRVCFHEHG
jgi:hypothetical protein